MAALYQLSYVGLTLASYRRRAGGGGWLSTPGMTWASVCVGRVSSAMGAGRPELWRPEHPLECTVVPDRDELIKRLAAALAVSDARRSGDPQTRVRLDHYLPSVGGPGSAVRWRLYTPRHRLIGVPGPEPARSAWHRADAAKGRRLLAVDVRNSNRVAAFLSWHFEDPDIKPPRAKAGRRRPHLITSVCVREDVEGRLRWEYMTAALLLTLVVSAIDTVTVAHGRVGVLRTRGPSSRPGSSTRSGSRPVLASPTAAGPTGDTANGATPSSHLRWRR